MPTTKYHTFDFQAIASGARSIFERTLDLEWVKKFPSPEWIERYTNFPNVDRYMACEKVVKHAQNNKDSSIDTSAQIKFMGIMNKREPFDSLVARIWGTKKNGSPARPHHHWTGEGDVGTRAKELGTEFTEAHLQIYPPMSWLVHAGPTAYWGRDFEHIEGNVGSCFFFASRYGYAATLLAVELLNIEDSIADFQNAMNQILVWLDEALNIWSAAQ